MDKVYLKVAAEFGRDGSVTPLWFEDGDERVPIERADNIIEIEKDKNGNLIHSYNCMARNRQFYLLFDGNRWYINVK